MAPCPSDLKLEAYLLGATEERLEPHLGDCARCRERLGRMEREGEEFLRRVYPVTVGRVVAAAHQRSRRRWALVLAPAAAAAAAIVLLVPPLVPPDGHVALKGDPLGLTVFEGGPSGARAVANGETVAAAAALRFQVRPVQPCHLWIVSVDAAGQTSRLFPASGDGGALVRDAGALPGGARLDGVGGPERIYAVCSRQPLALASLDAACRRAAGTGDEALRKAGALDGLPAGAIQSTLLLEKQP